MILPDLVGSVDLVVWSAPFGCLDCFVSLSLVVAQEHSAVAAVVAFEVASSTAFEALIEDAVNINF